MDTLTHALSGMLAARATRKQNSLDNHGLSLRSRMAAGFLASAFPDIDFIFWFIGDLSYLNNHRGLTHSVIMLPIWALLLSMAFSWLWRGRYQWREFYGISAIGIGIHILGDIITAYGTMILAPLSTAKFAFPTTFILDPWFSGIILLGLLLAWGFKQQARRIAITGMAVLLGFVGYQAHLHQRAISIAESYRSSQGWATAQVHALPQFLSPYHWKLIITHQDQYHVAYVNIIKQQSLAMSGTDKPGFISQVCAYFKPVSELNWLVHDRYGKQADKQKMAWAIWSLDEFSDIRRFMKFPALDRIELRPEGTCGIFIDHRFVIDGLRTTPFQFGACQNKQAKWRVYRFKAGKLIKLM